MTVARTTQRPLSNDMLRFSATQALILVLIDGAREKKSENGTLSIKNLSISIGRARRVVPGTSIEHLEQVPRPIWDGFT